MCRRCIDLSSLKDFVERQQGPAIRSKKAVLLVLTSQDQLGDSGKKTGWSVPEVGSVHAVFKDADYNVIFASPKGGIAPHDPDSVATNDSKSFYHNTEKMGLTKTTLPIGDAISTDFDCVFYIGGAGCMWDFPDCIESQTLACSSQREALVI